MNFLSSAVSSIKPRLDDYGTDRLNYYYSTMVIMVLSVTITAKQYVGSPLQCWVPAQKGSADPYSYLRGALCNVRAFIILLLVQ
ncbi:unnamed protein product [Heligmosomoides polygyrus]|uniref:Innexin n=1 Tax=Heligmosomoides polygyrus TaxID=6339 RepID=A0A183F4Z5_HELPZ|nr:unnamed protein product [Heligmosomoides polygyrus]